MASVDGTRASSGECGATQSTQNGAAAQLLHASADRYSRAARWDHVASTARLHGRSFRQAWIGINPWQYEALHPSAARIQQESTGQSRGLDAHQAKG